ncbi:glycoside hydrolase family 88 protein [Dactylosporangium matsuzakiense]|uniref:Glucuronyl hydrolase n=1 Tax=Dactylosporangium matsuzakiense TaxID=53360 RepID=A0A9W6NP88_9ACTN|nr:glycoside hydrolase family 88 protein [Dactylosporangium matsuzakiense]UWZ46883.1 glycoside hydrolase family 88 protein [Dactylosporangium matsuzakiense]GLL04229.1 glucuronyl hydrolase [Dactylosporangium matsuzakiense]
MLRIDYALSCKDLLGDVERMFELSAGKILALDPYGTDGSPVFTVDGRYTARGWTEWTQGFQVGSALLQFDATGDERFRELGLEQTRKVMAPHVSHIGVHDHGFNNVSTYGAVLRLIKEGRIEPAEQAAAELALKVSGAVQAARWQKIEDGTGYIYSFNGPQSLFVDTIRSCRSLAVAHRLGHVLMGEHDEKIDLRERMRQHAANTARYNVFYGTGRDAYDVRGRTVHEALFNTNDGRFRAPSTQQGYSPFSTWTRGLAWAMLGFAELLEFEDDETFRKAAQATCDFYIDSSPADGVPYWDTGAPGLHHLDLDAPADPYNAHEPVDSSAAAIGAQGLLRLGHALGDQRYTQAGLTVARALLQEPYLATDPSHQGLLLHSVYHRPNGWDQIHEGQQVPNGESSMWGDYHLRELGLYLLRLDSGPYYTFFGGVA